MIRYTETPVSNRLDHVALHRTRYPTCARFKRDQDSRGVTACADDCLRLRSCMGVGTAKGYDGYLAHQLWYLWQIPQIWLLAQMIMHAPYVTCGVHQISVSLLPQMSTVSAELRRTPSSAELCIRTFDISCGMP